MKKLLVLCMLGMMLFNGTAFAGERIVAPSPGDDLVINLKFIFHRPKFECQRGFGVCLVFSATWEETKTINREEFCLTRGYINERNQLVVSISEEDLTKYENGAALPYFKDKTSISILDPYNLPDETCKALGASPPLTIKPGNYPVSYSNGVYTVIFQL